MTRRTFLATAAAPLMMADSAKRPALCMFSKHFPELKYDELGKTCKDLGFAGIDLTVRPKGHVLPERVADDLPRAVVQRRRSSEHRRHLQRPGRVSRAGRAGLRSVPVP